MTHRHPRQPGALPLRQHRAREQGRRRQVSRLQPRDPDGPRQADRARSRTELLQALQRAAILSNEKFRGVRLVLGRRPAARSSARTASRKRPRKSSRSTTRATPLDIGFNITYLLDVLQNLAADRVALRVRRRQLQRAGHHARARRLQVRRHADAHLDVSDVCLHRRAADSEVGVGVSTSRASATAMRESTMTQHANPQPAERNGDDYDSTSIKILKGLDAVRKRPGMYIGDTSDGTGLHHMVFEVLDNAIDEALAGYCDDIKVVIHADNSVSVHRQRPRHSHRHQGRRRAEALGRRDRDDRAARRRQVRPEHLQGVRRPARRRRVGGQRAVRMAEAHDLARRPSCTRWNSAAACRWRRSRSSARPTGAAPKCISWPSTETFSNVEFHYEILAKRIRELSFLNNGVKIELIDQRDGKSENFAYSGGIKGFVEYMNRSKSRAAPEDLPRDRREGRHHRRSRDAVERLVRRDRCSASPTTSRSATAART